MQLFVNDLTVIDFSYCCRARGIVGESWIVDVLLDGSLNEMSMVLDFAVVKKQIKAIIDDAVDHKLLLPILDDTISVEISPKRAGHEFVNFSAKQSDYYLQSPSCAFAKIATKQIDVASVTAYLTTMILAQLPKNVEGLTLNLRPEIIDGAYYHYTHGLKLHDGNCQRIAHGHRSKIHIYKNGQRSVALEEAWSLRWHDIYLASDADRTTLADIELSDTVSAKILDVVDCDSTVELLADFIVRQLKQQAPNDEFKVVAFEGVAKGAIANG